MTLVGNLLALDPPFAPAYYPPVVAWFSSPIATTGAPFSVVVEGGMPVMVPDPDGVFFAATIETPPTTFAVDPSGGQIVVTSGPTGVYYSLPVDDDP